MQRVLFQPFRNSILKFTLPPKGFSKFGDPNKFKTRMSPKGRGGPPTSGDPLIPSAVAFFGLLFGLYMASYSTNREEVSLQELIGSYVMTGKISSITVVNRQIAKASINGEEDQIIQVEIGSVDNLEQRLIDVQKDMGIRPKDYIPIKYVTERGFFDSYPNLISMGVLLLPFLLLRRGINFNIKGLPGGPGGPGGDILKRKAWSAKAKDVRSSVKFTDVAGLHSAKREVTEFIDFLRAPEKFEHLGAKIPKGGLLVGPPGTGKTLLAKAMAGEADCPFFSITGSDFIEVYVGVGASRVRDLFSEARKNAPSIIFIDEIDAVGRKRGKGGFGGNDERENTLNQLLVEMDGFTTSTGVIVLAGTNRVDILDPALTRAGRFDRQISVDKPDLAERKEIFHVHLKPLKINDSISIDEVAQRLAALTPGFAGAEIANICNEAAIYAARRSSDSVSMDDFERASERVIGGLPKNNLMGEKEKKKVSIHESGHAIVGWFLEHADPLLKVTIIPRTSGALGFAQYLPDELSLYSKQALLDKICVALGGRVAEELLVKQMSTGASDDLNKVTQLAYGMVSTYGMSEKIGLVSYPDARNNEAFKKPFSEHLAMEIDIEAKKIVDAQYERVVQLLTSKVDLLEKLSARLLEKETLVYSDIREILGDRPYGIKKEYKEYVEGTKVLEPLTLEAKIENVGVPVSA